MNSRPLPTWARSHFNKKEKQEKNISLWKRTTDNVSRPFTETLFVTNFMFKTGLDYEIKQLSKKVLQFTKVLEDVRIIRS